MEKYILLTLSRLATTMIVAQVDKSKELFKTLTTHDGLLFKVGFNNCDIRQFENLVSDSFEFYHDKAGITSHNRSIISSAGLMYFPHAVMEKGYIVGVVPQTQRFRKSEPSVHLLKVSARNTPILKSRFS